MLHSTFCITMSYVKKWEEFSSFIITLNSACLQFHGAKIQPLFCPCGRNKKVKWK
jgi:hypothetical protein